MNRRTLARASAPVLVLSLMLVACGDDDDDAATTTTEAPADDTTTTAASGGDNAELCALAEEIDQIEIPSAAQIEQYTALAPPELADAVAIAGPPIIAADGDIAAFLTGIAADDVEDAIFDINDWEAENCGIDHDPRYPAEANELDPDATRVDVTASEYTFEFAPQEIPAGPISFVLTNAGQEVHFVAFSQINDGHTLEEALSFDGDPDEAGITSPVEYDSGLAAPGGDDEEIVTNDLEAGNYVMLCFIPGPDGPPHAFSGMAVPFTVS